MTIAGDNLLQGWDNLLQGWDKPMSKPSWVLAAATCVAGNDRQVHAFQVAETAATLQRNPAPRSKHNSSCSQEARESILAVPKLPSPATARASPFSHAGSELPHHRFAAKGGIYLRNGERSFFSELSRGFHFCLSILLVALAVLFPAIKSSCSVNKLEVMKISGVFARQLKINHLLQDTALCGSGILEVTSCLSSLHQLELLPHGSCTRPSACSAQGHIQTTL